MYMFICIFTAMIDRFAQNLQRLALIFAWHSYVLSADIVHLAIRSGHYLYCLQEE